MQPSTSGFVIPLESPYLASDLDEDRIATQQRENAAQQALDMLGSFLDNADHVLSDAEKDRMLGSALMRRCQELADAIAGLAAQLDQQSDEEKRALAQACLQDADAAVVQWGAAPQQREELMLNSSEKMSSLSEDDMMLALSGAQSLLKDVEYALRSIDRHDADEIADVALTLARLFLVSLQNLHSTLTPQELAGTSNQTFRGISGEVEIWEEGDDIDDASDKQASTLPRKGRCRVLWPPLGPAVVSACEWGKDEAVKKPLLAVALGLTLWPAAIATAMVGAPLVLADGVVQNVYNNFSDGPLVANLERGAAQLYHAGRLSFLCGGLVCRQTWRVASRQVERHGGFGKVAQDLQGVVVDRALHPIETVGLAWDGFCFGIGAVQEVISNVQQFADREMDTAATTLH